MPVAVLKELNESLAIFQNCGAVSEGALDCVPDLPDLRAVSGIKRSLYTLLQAWP